MKKALITLFRNRTLQLALIITAGVMAGQHLIYEHILSTRHLDGVEHLFIFALTGLWMLPASVLAVALGLRLARVLGAAGQGWMPRIEQAGLISLVMADLLVMGVALQPLTHTIYDALAPFGHAHSGDWLSDLLIAQLLTFLVALAGLVFQAVVDIDWRSLRFPLPTFTVRKRVVAVAVIASLLLSILPFQAQNGILVPATTQAATDACSDNVAPQRTYDVTALPIRITLNRFGDYDPAGVLYVLTENVNALLAEASANATNNRRVSTGLRDDLIQPLVIRANLGECVTINFTNQLNQPASFHAQGLAYSVDNAGGMVGANPNTFAGANGGTRQYKISMPPATDPTGEGAYYFYSHGASRALTSHGLFGALVAEPPGSTYLHAQTGQPVKSGWEAMIVDPNGSDFREFTLLWHEIGDERADIFGPDDRPLPVLDQTISGAYRPGSRAMNYRSEPFMDRLLLQQANGQQMDKALAYSSYTFGDPATPMPRSYLGEPTKTRLVHAGSEMFHVYHLHGGGTRWRRNPFADDRNEFDRGLKKAPTQDAFSVRLDSQSVGPSESFTLEHECAAGGCQQTAGDYLFHCHIGPHYVAGMWSFWRVYDTIQPNLATLPDRTQAPTAVNSVGLAGTVVEGKTLLPAVQVTDAATQIAIEDWAAGLLPVQGVPFDDLDATVWNWTIHYVDGDPNKPLVLSEPESPTAWVNYTPQPTTWPEGRPEILFNPTNGRYAWPLMRPHLGRRPPFSPNKHSGAPWAGETATATRPDGMCPDTAPNTRFYPVTAIQKPLKVTPVSTDPGGMIYVLNEDKQAVVSGAKEPEPLVLRSNVGDCVDIILTSSLEDVQAFHEFSKVNLHIHFVQFDPQASDGVISGMSFEQSVRPYTTELSVPGSPTPVGRTLTVDAAAGSTQITVSDPTRLRVGIAIGIGLDRSNVEIRTITAINGNVLTLDQPLAQDHIVGEPTGVEFVRARWYSDVDSGTVFYHSHVTFTDWYHGLIGAHIIEPAGSTYHDPTTGQEVRSGTIVDIRTTGKAGNVSEGPWPPGNVGDLRGFREFVVFFTADSPANAPSGGTINLRASPFSLRGIDPSRIFSSVTNGEPWTQIFRTYLGDPVMIRGMSVVEKEGALRFTGHRFRLERFEPKGVEMDTAGIDVSERYDLILEGGAGGIQQKPGDYLYYTTIKEQFVDGAWGLMRVFDRHRNDLQALPGRPQLSTEPGGFPQQTVNGGAPQPAVDPGDVCPQGAPVRAYEAVIFNHAIPYSPGLGGTDPGGIVYALAEDEAAVKAGAKPVRPLVLRTNVGDCLEIGLTNKLAQSASLSAGELTFDPQGSYGGAIGFNMDSTVAPNSRRVYRFYADKDVGVTMFYNLANPDTAARGAFGAIVVEPTGSIYRNPIDGTPARSGIIADVITPGGSFREFVGLIQDEDDIIGQNQMPYPTVIQGFTGLNYVSELFADRLGVNPTPAQIFDSQVHGDPANLLETHLGDPVRLRIGKPWGTQGQVFGIEGHRWPLEPNMVGSNLISSKSFRAGETFDMLLVGGAGGRGSHPGDYFFGDMRGPFMEAGVWGMMRVRPDNTTGPMPLPQPGVMLEVSNTASAALINPNNPVTFNYALHNPGTVPLSAVTVNDDVCAALNNGLPTPLGDTNSNNVLDPGETWTYTCTIATLTATVANKLTVTASAGAGVVEAAAFATVTVVTPQLTLTRPAPAAQVQAGQPIAFAYEVSGGFGGTDSLSSVVVTDDVCQPLTRTGGDTNGNNILEPTETWTYACTTVLNVNGEVTSTASVNAVDSLNAPVVATKSLTIQVLAAGIELAVQVDPTPATLGQTVNYTYTVTNNANAPLNNVTVNDSFFGKITLDNTTLLSGETAMGLASLTIGEVHLPGPLTSNVTVVGTPTVPPSANVTANASTSVALSASPSIAVTREAGPTPAGIGETVFYTFTVTNNGATTLSNVTADDTYFGPLLQPAVALNPGQSIVRTRSVVVTENLLPGPIADTVTASGTPPANLGIQTAVDGGAIDLTYNAGLEVTRTASPNPVTVGDTINYLFTIKNIGNVTLSDLVATDSRWSVIGISVNSLAPNEQTTISHVYTVRESDLPGPLAETLTVTGMPPGNLPLVSTTNTGSVDLLSNTALAVSQVSSAAQVSVGQPVTFTYTVQNQGNLTLNNVVVSLSYPSAQSQAPVTLGPGESTTGATSGVALETDLPGPLVSTVSATGTPGVGAPVSGSSTASALLTSNPALQLTMLADKTTAAIGETIAYTYQAKNVGNVTLQNVAVVDARLGIVPLDFSTLAPNATATGQRTHVVVEADLPGPYANSGTATGIPAYGGGGTVSANGSASVNLTSAPAIKLTLETSAASASVGEAVVYSYTVENTGNVTLKTLSLTDSRFGAISLGAANLAPGETRNRVQVLTVQESHLPGPLNNSATVTARSNYAPFALVSSNASAALTLTPDPGLTVVRAASTGTATIGERVYYTFTVTNNGDITISGLSASNTLLGNIVLGASLLAPGQSTTGSKSYLVGQSDLPGPLVDTFTATGLPTGGGGSITAGTSGVVSLTYDDTLQVERSATPNPAEVGIDVTYRFTVTNLGNVTLSNLDAVDTLLGAVQLDRTSLAPGQRAVGSRIYAVNEADLPGPLNGMFTVTASPPNNLPDVVKTASGSVGLVSNPLLEVVQTVNLQQAEIGDTVIFTMKMTNKGNVTLSNVVVEHDFPAQTSLPAFSLPPGTSTTRVVVHVVDESDLPGPLTNNVQVTAKPPVGANVMAVDADAVALSGAPEIKLSLYASHATAAIGDTVVYTYEVKNRGNQTLQSVNVVDSRFGAITLGTTILAPEDQVTGHFTHVVQESDLPGPIANATTAAGTPQYGGSATVKSSDSHVLTLSGQPALTLARQASRSSATVDNSVTYTYTMRNTGDVTLVNLKLVDTRLGNLSLSKSELKAGESIVVTGKTAVDESDLPGPLANTATAQGTPKFGGGGPLSASRNGSITLFGLPSVNLIEEVNTTIANVGETIFYTFIVENVGNVTLVGLSLEDSKLGVLDLDTDSLAAGARATRAVAYTVTAADLPGPINNQATVTGVPIYQADNPGGAALPTRSTGGTVSLSQSTVTIRHEMIAGSAAAPFAFEFGSESFSLHDGEAKAFAAQAPGEKTITLNLPSNWEVESVVCDSGVTATVNNVSGSQAGGAKVSATIDLTRGVQVACSFMTRQVAFDLYLPVVAR